MGDPGINCFFEPRRGADARPRADAHRHDDGGSASGVLSVPAALLQRHGALVLDPGTAAAVHGYPAPRSTVYRARTLLVPGELLQDAAALEAINAVLARVGMTLVPPEPGRAQGATSRGNGPVPDGLRNLPRPAVLVPARPVHGEARPVVIDAWVALQALRAAAGEQRQPAPQGQERKHPPLGTDTVRTIALEHVLVASALIGGSPASGTGGGITAAPSDSSGVTGPSATGSYVYTGGDTRAPVAVCLEAPERMKDTDCDAAYGRRPVVAVLDTGIRAHYWLGVDPDPPNGYLPTPGGFVDVDHDIQKAIREEGQNAVSSGDLQRQPIKHPWDTPVTADPLVGELDTDTGHGTFIAGIVRQAAPDARVLAVKVMHSDGIVNEGDLLCALRLLALRIAHAEAGDLPGMVDVVSLSLGYFDESADDVAFSSGLWQVIKVLLGMGVTVVAAAGNYSTSRKFFPAAFTEEPTAGPVPIIGVGALNPNLSKALFSNGGRWVTAWAAGAAVVSTFPTDIDGSRCPEIRMRAHPGNEMPPGVPLPAEREALDPDDYHGGFATWSGTSFSAPLLAANIARSLMEGAAATASLRLSKPGEQEAKDRAAAALTKLGWQG